MTVIASRYTRDDLYTYEEVEAIVGVSYGHVVDNALNGTITQIKLPSDRRVYFPKYEIDPLKGLGRIGSRQAKELIRAAREANRDYIAEEQVYGDPIEKLPPEQVVKDYYHEDPTGFWDAVKKATGIKSFSVVI